MKYAVVSIWAGSRGAVTSDVDGDGEVGDERLQPGAEAAAGERGGEDAADDVAQLAVGALGVASASSIKLAPPGCPSAIGVLARA